MSGAYNGGMTTALTALARVPAARRAALAWQVRNAPDIDLPDLRFFNSSPCDRHDTVDPECQRCGIVFRAHQRIGVTWLYLVGKGLLGDTVGSGKTGIAIGLLALLAETGELHEGRRAALVVESGSPVEQWQAQLDRLLPGIPTALAAGTRKDRVERYLQPWTALLMGYHTLMRDVDDVANFPIGTLIVDDVEPLRDPASRTAYCVKRLAGESQRVVVMTGTSLQKRLHELHAVLEPVGGRQVFGSDAMFRRRFVREEQYTVVDRSGNTRTKTRVVGYRNLGEFRRLLAPMVLRRTAADITDVQLPAISPHQVWLDLSPLQAQRYRELRAGVLTVVRASGTKIRTVKAAAIFSYGAMVCTSLAALGEADGPGTSVKLDWLLRVLEGDLAEEKVVCFVNNRNTIRALSARLKRADIDHELVWGEVRDRKARFASQQRFWDDPDCRVLIGTSAIERSLNLQVARHLICVDTVLNAGRMTQLAGRVRRDGSRWQTVYVHTLLTRGTQEEGYLPLLEKEQALQDVVWGETSELFAQLDPLKLLMLIGNSSV